MIAASYRIVALPIVYQATYSAMSIVHRIVSAAPATPAHQCHCRERQLTFRQHAKSRDKTTKSQSLLLRITPPASAQFARASRYDTVKQIAQAIVSIKHCEVIFINGTGSLSGGGVLTR